MFYQKNGILKNVVILLLICVMLFLNSGMIVAYAQEQFVSEDEAKYLAISCVWNVQEIDSDTFEQQDLSYSDTFTLYNDNLDVSAYVVNFQNAEGSQSGYVVVSATSDYPEIIEFSDTGKSPYEEQYELLCKEYGNEVYPMYAGNIEPLCIEKETETLVEYNEGVICRNTLENETHSVKYSVKDRKEKAANIRSAFGTVGRSSSLGDANFFITRPDNYEENYKSCATSNLSWYSSITFKTTSDFKGKENHCGPTAATNLLMYWAKKNSEKYGGFMQGDSTWETTFQDLYDAMFKNDTTEISAFAKQTAKFTQNHSQNGLTFKYYTFLGSTWDKVTTEIKAGRPIVLLLQGHKVYGNHYVVGLGYMAYTYSNGDTSNYVRIADGWISTATRFVNFTQGYNNSLVKVYLITAQPK